MSIRWDALLVRHLAEELDATLRGARLRALRFDAPSRDLALLFRDRTLLWRLHPERGAPLLRDVVEPQEGDLALRARVRRVSAPPDERVIVVELHGERRGQGPWELIVELMGNQLNALVVEAPTRTIRHLLRRRDGRRPARVGAPYEPPVPTGRLGADGALEREAWLELLEPVPPPQRGDELVRRVAWTSPLNAETYLADDLTRGWETWRRHARGAAPTGPVVLDTERGPQPYPFALRGLEARPAGSLLEALEACAAAAGDDGSGAEAVLAVGPELLARLEDAVAVAERRVVRLHAELEEREDPASLRALGDLILARYGEIPRGATEARLVDFEGAEVEVALDPGAAPHDNAARYYDRASRSERAAERLPGLIAEAEAEHRRVEALLAAARAGATDADAVRAALPRARPSQRRGDAAPALPYRTFRTSGGLEVRVGRGSKHNDDLTFHHSSPADVWLHARHAAGAHVVLRWTGEGAPPARDLHEAGALAALHSKARTSGSAPVDWTRRKYVRKPRGAPPGSVVPDRVSTIFVEPDASLLERLAVDD